jgi:hypothetical protein
MIENGSSERKEWTLIENDNRKEHRGFRVNQQVTFRWCRQQFKGKITRLTSSKALIQFKLVDSSEKFVYVAYNQIEK